jgi:hypothetical protein
MPPTSEVTVTAAEVSPARSYPELFRVCVECLIGKQKKPILFKVTEPSSVTVPSRGLCCRSCFGPRTCGRGITYIPKRFGALDQGLMIV